jgi:hypothetical protein
MKATTRIIPVHTQLMPTPTAAPVDRPEEDFGGIVEGDVIEVVVLLVLLVLLMDVLVAIKPEAIVKYGIRADEAGAANVSSVGESQLGVLLESMPQQCHKLVVAFQYTSGRAWSTMLKGSKLVFFLC